MTTYKVYEVDEKVSAKGNAYKKLVLQEPGAQYPLKNVTMFSSHPLFEDIAPGQTVELDIEVKDSTTPNPKGGFYKNRTVLNPGQTSKAPAPKPADGGPHGDRVLETYNLINLKVIPKLDWIAREIAAISGRQERQLGLDPRAIDESMGVEPKDIVGEGDDLPF